MKKFNERYKKGLFGEMPKAVRTQLTNEAVVPKNLALVESGARWNPCYMVYIGNPANKLASSECEYEEDPFEWDVAFETMEEAANHIQRLKLDHERILQVKPGIIPTVAVVFESGVSHNGQFRLLNCPYNIEIVSMAELAYGSAAFEGVDPIAYVPTLLFFKCQSVAIAPFFLKINSLTLKDTSANTFGELFDTIWAEYYDEVEDDYISLWAGQLPPTCFNTATIQGADGRLEPFVDSDLSIYGDSSMTIRRLRVYGGSVSSSNIRLYSDQAHAIFTNPASPSITVTEGGSIYAYHVFSNGQMSISDNSQVRIRGNFTSQAAYSAINLKHDGAVMIEGNFYNDCLAQTPATYYPIHLYQAIGEVVVKGNFLNSVDYPGTTTTFKVRVINTYYDQTVGAGETLSDGAWTVRTGAGGSVNVNTAGVTLQKLNLAALPTTDPGVSGAVWNNNGVLNISA